MRRNNRIAVLFQKVPDGTHYRKGAWSWVPEDRANEYISEGYGTEYDRPDTIYPRHKGGGHYLLSNGETVRGKSEAEQAEADL